MSRTLAPMFAAAVALVAAVGGGCESPPPRPKAEAPKTQAAQAPAPAPAKSLYERLGREPAIRAVVDEMLGRVGANPKINARFAGANMPRLRTMLVDQIGQATGGPQVYRGGDMRTVHRGMTITDAEFDALVGDLAGALGHFNVPPRETKELLSALAPMREQIVERPEREGSVEDRLARMQEQLDRIERALARLAPPGATPGTRAPAGPPRPASTHAVAAPTPAVAAAPPASFKAVDWTPEERKLAEDLVQRYASAAAKEGPAGGEPRADLIGRPLERTRFVSSTGEVFDLRDYQGKKKLVLVILRGYAGTVCINCSTQTLALAKRIDEFRARGAEVVLVYPGEASSLPAFIDSVRNLKEGFTPPFPVVLDVELAAVKTFRIEGSLAKPTSLVLDEQGIVRYAYVGKAPADRPSAQVLLDALDKLGK